MAHSLELWAKAKGYFEAGLSLRDIEKRTNITSSQIQKESKKKQWKHGKNAGVIKAEVEIKKQKETLKETGDNVALDCINEIANEIIIARQLISNALTDGIREAHKKIIRGEIVRKRIDPNGKETKYTEEYDQTQYKAFGEMMDKASITLGINQRHAQPNINLNTQQNNIDSTNKNTDWELLQGLALENAHRIVEEKRKTLNILQKGDYIKAQELINECKNLIDKK